VAIFGRGLRGFVHLLLEVAHLLFERVTQLIRSAAEFCQPFPQRSRDVRQLLGAEKQKRNKEYKPDLRELATKQGIFSLGE
jgi:hypothetical protein